MSPETKEMNVRFLQLIITLQASAMQQLGKVVSPVSGKVERNLELARQTIDLLSMLEEKTRGNLSADEEKFLQHILYELRLNYVDELNIEQATPAEAKKDSIQSNEDGSQPEK
jgi:hypothetical protein